MKEKNHYIQALQTNDDQVIGQIVKKFLPTIKTFIRQNGGSASDVFPVFVETLVVLLKGKHLIGDDATFGLYLKGICRWLWRYELIAKKQSMEVTLLGLDTFEDSTLPIFGELLDNYMHQKISKEKLEELEPSCHDILCTFFKEKNDEAIAKLLGITDMAKAKKRRNSCLKQFLSLIRADIRYQKLNNDK